MVHRRGGAHREVHRRRRSDHRAAARLRSARRERGSGADVHGARRVRRAARARAVYGHARPRRRHQRRWIGVRASSSGRQHFDGRDAEVRREGGRSGGRRPRRSRDAGARRSLHSLRLSESGPLPPLGADEARGARHHLRVRRRRPAARAVTRNPSTTAVLLLLLLAAASSARALAWGAQGHRLVALIAAERLTPTATQNVAWLLGSESLADVSSWADQYVEGNYQTFSWHFVNIPANATGYVRERDCPRQPSVGAGSRADKWRDCAVDRILYNQERLADAMLDRADRAIALKFLVHVVGDLHQPFHAVGVARGGNDIPVS